MNCFDSTQKSPLYNCKNTVLFVVITHILFVFIFLFYRILILSHFGQYGFPQSKFIGNFVVSTLLQGTWRDNYILMYLSGFVLLFISLFHKQTKINHAIRHVIITFYSIFSIFIVVVCSINIPFYFEFCKPLDLVSLSSISSSNSSVIIKMILEDSVYLSFFIASISLSILTVWMIVRFGKELLLTEETSGFLLRTKLILICFIILIVGFTLYFRPNQINRAEYSTDYSMDKIALNPGVYFISSIINKNSGAFNNGDAYIDVLSKEQLQSYLVDLDQVGIDLPSTWDEIHKIEDQPFTSNSPEMPNIVLIIMEGLSANLMESIGGNNLHITPFLDSLYHESLHFPNCYSVGQRTALGLSGILNSYPSLLTHGNLFNYSQACRFQGLAYQLHQLGYTNTFFIPHEGGFDSMRSYLLTHDFDKVYSKEDYPEEKTTITWGICDDKLFEVVIPIITEQFKIKQPSFTAMITISNHDPYELPDYFIPKNNELKYQAVEYADWSLRKFFSLAKQQEWYDKTIFILVADHGRVQQEKECELSEQMHHIPLMFFGSNIDAKECDSVTSQMDLMAILMGLLGKPYEYNNFSQNVLKKERDYVLYSAYDYLVCRSKQRLYLYRYESKQDACYIIKDGEYLRCEMDADFLLMKKCCLSYFQTADNITAPYKLTEGWM